MSSYKSNHQEDYSDADDEDEELLQRYLRLEEMTKAADKTGERYIVGTTSTGDLVLFFPDKKHAENLDEVHDESIHQQSLPNLAFKPSNFIEEFMDKQKEEKEEDARKKSQKDGEDDLLKFKNAPQNFKILFQDKNKIVIQEFDHVTPPSQYQEESADERVQIKEEL